MDTKVYKNNYAKYIVISVIAVLAIAGFVSAYSGTAQQVIENVENLTISNGSGVSGLMAARQSDIATGFWDVYVENDLTVDGDTIINLLVSGGGAYNSTTTDAATYTFVSADIATYSYLDLGFTAGSAITNTMPATSTMMTLLPSIGSTRTWTIHNASTTGEMTIAAGAGMNLLGIDTNVDTIAADGWATLECMQTVYNSAVNENIACLMAEYLVAD